MTILMPKAAHSMNFGSKAGSMQKDMIGFAKAMNIDTGLRKTQELSIAQLKHMIQLCDEEIVAYEMCIVNYPLDRMEKHGKPYLRHLEARKEVFQQELNRRL